jgi:D-alanyl-D-alanine carboxypeptidase/D-alanyl-D-alanine-endopeptidase (penicillin-binding protein 4)
VSPTAGRGCGQGGEAVRTAGARGLLAAAVVAVLGTAAATAVTLPVEPPPPAAAPSPAAPSAPVRGALLPALSGTAPVPTGAGLERALAQALADPALGGPPALSVVDAVTGQPLLEHRAQTPLLPASTAKIVTAVAALTALPPDLRLTTRVRAGTTPGEVVLVGGGDPTLAGPDSPRRYPPVARLADLAAQTRAALGDTRVTRVLVDESLWSGERLAPGWKPGYVDQGAVAPVGALTVDAGRVRPDRGRRHPDPALAAGQALAALLQPGASVPVVRGTAPAGARELAAVRSPVVPHLVERMLAHSDNDLAEALARHVALSTGHEPSFRGAAAAMRATLGPYLDEVGVGRDAVDLLDGSGLSRLDRLEPAALTRLLAAVASGDGSPTAERLAPVLAGLPVAGFSGTLSDRYREEAEEAAGVVRAKTGTLSGVSALAGLVRTADGRLLAFAVVADAVPGGRHLAAEDALDRLVAGLASCGCR